jgi:hypothetical protein
MVSEKMIIHRWNESLSDNLLADCHCSLSSKRLQAWQSVTPVPIYSFDGRPSFQDNTAHAATPIIGLGWLNSTPLRFTHVVDCDDIRNCFETVWELWIQKDTHGVWFVRNQTVTRHVVRHQVPNTYTRVVTLRAFYPSALRQKSLGV